MYLISLLLIFYFRIPVRTKGKDLSLEASPASLFQRWITIERYLQAAEMCGNQRIIALH
jgi:hypothetical protein